MQVTRGTSNNDIINSIEGDEFVFGLAGDDTLFSWLGSDTLSGGRGDDGFIVAPQFGGEICHINGGRGNDTLTLGREPTNIEYFKSYCIIEYDYDMTLIVKGVETIEWS